MSSAVVMASANGRKFIGTRIRFVGSSPSSSARPVRIEASRRRGARIQNYVRSNLSFAFDESLDLTPLAKLSGVERATLSSLQYLPVDIHLRKIGEYYVFDSPIPQYMIRLRYPKVCPRCLGETGYTRKIWELAPITTCPLHHCLLLDECPNCMKRITWARRRISRCQCTFDWREPQTPSVRAAELEVACRIHLLCNVPAPVTQRGGSTNTNPLDKLDLKRFLSALFFVASQYAGVIDTKGKHLASFNAKC